MCVVLPKSPTAPPQPDHIPARSRRGSALTRLARGRDDVRLSDLDELLRCGH
jgi:hypothetical protein